MKNVNCIALSGSDNQNGSGAGIDSNQLVSASFQAVFGDAQAAGTFKLQASNDKYNARYNYPEGNFTPTNWTDIPNQSATIASGASALLTIPNMCYRWIRATYTSTATGAQTIAPIADTGVLEAFIVTAPSTAAATQADYIVISGTTGVKTALWLDIDAAGTVPTGAAYVAATNKIKVSIITGGTATANGTILQAAAASTVGYTAVDNMDGTVTYTQTLVGPCTAPARHNADDSGNGSFVISAPTLGVVSNLNSTYFLLQDEASVHSYYVWMNVNSQGVDPLIAGRTAVPIAIAAGASAATIGTALASAIAALNSSNSFTTSGTTTVTVTNKTAGPFVPMTDGTAPTHFTFAVTAGGSSTIVVNMNALSL